MILIIVYTHNDNDKDAVKSVTIITKRVLIYKLWLL